MCRLSILSARSITGFSFVCFCSSQSIFIHGHPSTIDSNHPLPHVTETLVDSCRFVGCSFRIFCIRQNCLSPGFMPPTVLLLTTAHIKITAAVSLKSLAALLQSIWRPCLGGGGGFKCVAACWGGWRDKRVALLSIFISDAHWGLRSLRLIWQGAPLFPRGAHARGLFSNLATPHNPASLSCWRKPTMGPQVKKKPINSSLRQNRNQTLQDASEGCQRL